MIVWSERMENELRVRGFKVGHMGRHPIKDIVEEVLSHIEDEINKKTNDRGFREALDCLLTIPAAVEAGIRWFDIDAVPDYRWKGVRWMRTLDEVMMYHFIKVLDSMNGLSYCTIHKRWERGLVFECESIRTCEQGRIEYNEVMKESYGYKEMLKRSNILAR